jgi:hypothetical protein
MVSAFRQDISQCSPCTPHKRRLRLSVMSVNITFRKIRK